MALPHLVGGAQAFVSERRRKPDVNDRDIGAGHAGRAQEAVDVRLRRDDLHTRFGEQPRQAFTQQHVVVHDRYPHGRLAINRRRPSCSACEAARPRRPPGRRGALTWVCAEVRRRRVHGDVRAAVLDLDEDVLARTSDRDRYPRRRHRARICQEVRDEPVDGSLDMLGQPLGGQLNNGDRLCAFSTMVRTAPASPSAARAPGLIP